MSLITRLKDIVWPDQPRRKVPAPTRVTGSLGVSIDHKGVASKIRGITGVLLEEGETAWVHKDGKLVPRKVAHVFEKHGMRMYVVEVQTSIDTMYDVYDEHTVSDDKSRPIGFYRRAVDAEA